MAAHDPKNTSRIAQLIVKEIEGKITFRETVELQTWRSEKPEHEDLYKEFHNPVSIEKHLQIIREGNRKGNLKKIAQRLGAEEPSVLRFQYKGSRAIALKKFLQDSMWLHEVIDHKDGSYEFLVTVENAMDACRFGSATSSILEEKTD